MIYELLARDKCRFTLSEVRWRLEVRGKLFCTCCSTIFRRVYPQPVDVHLSQLYRNTTYGSVTWTRIGVIHERLLEALSPYLEGYVFGKCFDRNGRILSKYRSMYHWRYITIRDADKPGHRVCKQCGTMLSTWGDAPYALSAELAGARVWQNAPCTLYVDEHLARSIDWKPFRDIELYPIEVRDRIVEPAEPPAAPSRAGPEPAETPAAPPPIIVPAPAGEPRDRTPLRIALRRQLRDRGLEAEALTALMDLTRVGFRLEPAGAIVVPLSQVPLGASRLGGLPDLPPGAEWPRSPDGRPLAFLAQINLADTQGVRLDPPLPGTGQMYFFYNAQDQPGGYDEADQGHWRVLVAEANAADLRRTEPPAELAEECRFDVRAVRLEPRRFLPSVETLSELLEGAPRPGAGALQEALSSGRYATWIEEIHGLTQGDMDHRFLGHPQEVQSAMSGDLPRVESADLGPTPAGSSEPSWGQAPGGPGGDWQLLLQLDTNGGAGWMWGDSGRLYFWVPRADLRAWRFERVWVVLQCA